MVELLSENYGNPSSLHKKGFDAEQELKSARQTLALCLGAERDEIVFTSGGTEANNLALFGAASLGKRFGRRIVSTAFEHPSVLRPLEALQKEGFELCLIKPDRNGRITEDAILSALTPDTVLVSVMAVNNEVGTILPFDQIGAQISKIAPHALFHVDAVQAFCKIPIDVKKAKIDLLSASAHKIHGPKGAGLLYVRKGVRLPARTLGGGQERGFRSGTEALPAIAGFAAAAESFGKPAVLLPIMRQKAALCREKLSGIEGALSVDLTLIITLLMGLCGALSGSVLKYKPITACSVVATALSALLLMVISGSSPVRILSFVILGVFALLIPGLILQKQKRG